ncbi:SDR family oxidoreductase [Phenylobacterium sp.]|jgi:NAD(P)-dependent dehydrogenase (short-subunit alcohol dehydrogenase family)|uniref:SDR family NAD(P)-dependent oxidoreductase n=1 Tax=Phenylobacterium sp. TaxID=1871053 RepID=UPI002F940C2F
MEEKPEQLSNGTELKRALGAVAVTGASSGIGEAVATALSRAGVTVIGLDRDPPNRPPPGGTSMALDVTDEAEVELTIAAAEARFGPIGGLVNAAGILGKVHPPERLRLTDWQREINVDLTGTYIVSRAVGVRMAQRASGAIVNVASIAGMTSAPTHAYSAAKAGVISLTRSLARAWGRQGVRVNAVSPGFTRTPALDKGVSAGVLNASAMAEATALGRLLDASEIADAVVWLLGPGSRGVTGVNLPVDGGFLAGVTWPAYAAPA